MKSKFNFCFVIYVFFTTLLYSQWISIGPGQGEYINCIMNNEKNNSDKLFIGTAEGFWYYNTQNNTWQSRDDVGWIGRNCTSLLMHPDNFDRIITGRENGFFKGYLEYSNDLGITHSNAYNSDGGFVTDIKHIQNDTFLACTWSDINPGELLKSTDGGINWTLQTNYLHYILTQIAVDPINNNVIYISGDMGVTKSIDGGNTWIVSNTGLATDVGTRSLCISNNNPAVLIACGDSGIYRSTNYGANWYKVNSDPFKKVVFQNNGSDLAMGLSYNPEKKLFISYNLGITWSEFPVLLNDDNIRDISFSHNGDILYAASYRHGLFVFLLPLPVELVSFSIAVTDKITLDWKTATETNNLGFNIKRHKIINGIAGEEKNLGFVAGKGTTTEMSSYTFSDDQKLSGEYQYSIEQIDYDGTKTLIADKVVNVITSVQSYLLNQNYPNPFNPSTTISFSLPNKEFVTLKIYDALGKEITTLVNEELNAGSYKNDWNASNLTSGVYFYRLQAGKFSETRKLMIVK